MSQPAPLLSWSPRIGLLGILLLLFVHIGCSPVWQQGSQLAQAGRYTEAADYWLDVLETAQELEPAARRGVKRYGESAFRQQLDIAREHEAEQRYDAAIEAYDATLSLVARIEKLGLKTFTVYDDVQAERDDALEGQARYRYEQGIAAFDRREFSEAIRWWERAREARAEFEDTSARIGAAWRAQAEIAVEERRYQDAIDAWSQAHEWTGNLESKGWAAAIRAALGRYYLKNGGCRQAVELLEHAASDVTNDPRLPQDLATAQDCAEIELVVHPFDQSPGTEVSGTDMGTLVADRMSEQLGNKGSRYVRLIDRSTSRSLESRRGRRYDVRGRISQLTVERPAPEVRDLSTSGTTRDLCPGIEGYYSTRDEYCDDTFSVTYKETHQRVEMRISASVRVVEPRSGEQVLTRSLESGAEVDTVYATDFRRGDALIETGRAPGKLVAGIDPAILALQTEPEPLPSDSELVATAADNLAANAADAILAQVDHEPKVAGPKLLANLRNPLVNPEDIRLTPGTITAEPDKQPEPQGDMLIYEPDPGPLPAPE